jgi:hypothetical protein
MAISLAGFAIGSLFRKAFEGAFEAAADAQQRALSLTNEFWLHMKKQGYEAAEAQTKWLIDFNQTLAKTGVLGRGVFDAMADGLSKIGLAPKEIAAMEPILGGLLVRAKGIRATTADAEELTNNVMRAAKGGRMIGLMTSLKMPVGPSERARLKAYGDDWRGAVQYFMFLASKYKDFNVAMKNTPLGQIQRMRNTFAALARDIGETMLPAQADMAAAWEEALPTVKPLILTAMQELAMLITSISKELIALAQRFQMPDVAKSVHDLTKAFKDLLDVLGLEWPEAGFFGRLIAGSVILSIKILTVELKILKKLLEGIKWLMDHIFFREAIKDYPKMVEQMNRIRGIKPQAAQPAAVMPPVPAWVKKDPRLLAAYMQGAAPAARGPSARPTVPYNAPPPPPAAPAGMPPTSQFPITPAAPSIPIYGQPAGVGGMGTPSGLPPGATMPYGPTTTPVPAGGAGAGGGGAAAASAPIVGALGDIRKRYAEELKDPETMRLLMASAQAEVGYKDPARLQAYIESVLNRAAATGKSLSAILRDPHYYPAATKNQLGAQFSAAQAARYAPAIQAALAGSNVSNYATGNESGGVHSGGARVAFASGGERFVEEKWTADWVRRMRQQAAIGEGTQIAGMQAGGIVTKPTLALLGERGPEAVLPSAKPSPLPSPPGAGGASMMSRMMTAMSPYLPYAQAALQGRFYAPSWMMGGKGQWMQASMGSRMKGEAGEINPFVVGEGFRMPIMAGAVSAIGKWIGKTAGNEYNMTHSPTIHIHGNADADAQRAIKIHLEDSHKKFIQDFKDAQRHERRLSYESGYSG